MKKKVLHLMAVAVVALVAGYNVYTAQKSKVDMSDLALANVEALATNESGGNLYCCGNYGVCMVVFNGSGSYTVMGIKSPIPCPQ